MSPPFLVAVDDFFFILEIEVRLLIVGYYLVFS
jgi:hypothetical protein